MEFSCHFLVGITRKMCLPALMLFYATLLLRLTDCCGGECSISRLIIIRDGLTTEITYLLRFVIYSVVHVGSVELISISTRKGHINLFMNCHYEL